MQTHLLSENAAVACKCFRPAGVGENDDVVVSRLKDAPEQRRNAQIREEVFGNRINMGAFLLAVLFQCTRGIRLTGDREERG